MYDTLEEGKAATRENEVWGVLVFGNNYTESTIARLDYDIFSTPNDIVDSSHVDAYLDMSSEYILYVCLRCFIMYLDKRA